LRGEAQALNHLGGWAGEQEMECVLPGLAALDQTAALNAALAVGSDAKPHLHAEAGVAGVEAALRDLAAWASGVRAACELSAELRARG
jgi:hypothetical protein